MKKLRLIILLSLLVLVIAGGLYFKDNIFKIYSDFDENLKNFEKTELGNIINEIKKEVLTPPPLNVGGKETGAILDQDKVIAETNIRRYNNGLLPPLIKNKDLAAAAMAKAEDMFKKQYFEHVSPSGIDPGTLVKNFGYEYIVTGENLILGNFENEKEMVQLWMDSPGHRANILNERFTEIGVAVLKGVYNGQTVWIGVQEFGLPLSSCPEPSLDLKNQIDLNKNELDWLASEIDAKRNELENTSPRSPKYNQLVSEHNQLVEEYNSLSNQTKKLVSQYNSQINSFNLCIEGL